MICSDIVPWIFSHWPEIAPVAIVILSSIVNRITKHQDDHPRAIWWISSIIDMLSITQAKGSDRKWKLPLLQSDKPKAKESNDDKNNTAIDHVSTR